MSKKLDNAIARECPKDAALAIQLFDSGIYEARLLCSKIFPAITLTSELADRWVTIFDTWEICDAFCSSVFARSPLALAKIEDWKDRQPEYEKRAAYATIACFCHVNKTADNNVFRSLLPWIEGAATDDRTYVKKAVHWALRSIGKRNNDLHREAIAIAQELIEDSDKNRLWVGKQVLAELCKPDIRISNYPRHHYI